jgi:uncharacterized membrane protein YvbJ
MAAKSKCVHCGEAVGEWTRDCPKCGKPVANPDAPVLDDIRSGWSTTGEYRKKSAVPYIAIVALVAVIGVVVYYLRSQI